MAIQLAVQTETIQGLDVLRERLGDSGAIRRNVTPILREAARIGTAAARHHAPKGRTRRLHDAIENDAIVFRVRGNEVAARFGLQPVTDPGRGSRLYPIYVHEGTGLYGRLHRMITPKRAKAMEFPDGGKPWPTQFGETGSIVKRAVRGQKANPYMERGYDEAHIYVERHLDDMFNRLVE